MRQPLNYWSAIRQRAATQSVSPQLIGKPAPELEVANRVQGEPVNISALKGRVVVVEVFQVNCPGCFVHALPEVVDDAAVNTFIHG